MIEEYLEHGVMKCIAFNRRGTLLAGIVHKHRFSISFGLCPLICGAF